MKYLILFSMLFLATITQAQKSSSSLRFGLKGGLSTTSIDAGQLEILDQGGLDRLELAVKDAKYGFHLGVLLRAQINKFIIQPEVLFNSSQVDYTVDDLGGTPVADVLNEKYNYLDIPVLLGFKFGPLRLQAGPVGHVFLSSSTELSGITNIDYRQEFKDMTIGWQGNLGLDIWNLMLDFRYEGNFTNFGDHINFAGRHYEFDDKPSRWVFSVGYLF